MNSKTNDVIVDGVPCVLIAGEPFFSYEVAAAYGRCAKGTVANWVYSGQIRAIKLGRYAYASKRDFDKTILRDRAA